MASRALLQRVNQVRRANTFADEIDATSVAVWNRILWLLQFVRPIYRLIAEITSELEKLQAIPAQLETWMRTETGLEYERAADTLIDLAPRPTKERLTINPSNPWKVWQTVLKAGAGRDKNWREIVKPLVFPKLEAHEVDRLVHANGWKANLQRLTRLANPQDLATRVSQVMSAGGGVRDIARQLLPMVNGVKASARRVARTEYLRVAQAANYEAYEQMGDLITGYQVHGIMDDRIRPEHRARNGTVYYKQPQPNQKGMKECPHPPLEANGKVAHNCRCFIAPVFKTEPAGYLGTRGHIAPIDPRETSAWFDSADEATQKITVGPMRFNLVKDIIGRPPQWFDFLNPAGRVASRDELLHKHVRHGVTI
jgi:SPP1 gp7 family putative phage head morphogenesis protein